LDQVEDDVSRRRG